LTFPQKSLAKQAVRAIVRELASVADQAVIAHQFVIIPGTIIGNRMWCAGIVTAGEEHCLVPVR